MDTRETYRGSTINVFTSLLASGQMSFVIHIDGEMLTAAIDGPSEDDTIVEAFKTGQTGDR